MGVNVLVFTVESVHETHFLRFLREDWDGFQNEMYVEGRKKHQKIRF